MKYDEAKERAKAFAACPLGYDWGAFWLGWKASLKAVLDPENADMFWDADDPEDSYGDSLQEIANNLADNLSPHDGRVEVNVQCAVSIPNVKLEVWVDVDSEDEQDVHYEVMA
jgi:hypothetical protein